MVPGSVLGAVLLPVCWDVLVICWPFRGYGGLTVWAGALWKVCFFIRCVTGSVSPWRGDVLSHPPLVISSKRAWDSAINHCFFSFFLLLGCVKITKTGLCTLSPSLHLWNVFFSFLPRCGWKIISSSYSQSDQFLKRIMRCKAKSRSPEKIQFIFFTQSSCRCHDNGAPLKTRGCLCDVFKTSSLDPRRERDNRL